MVLITKNCVIMSNTIFCNFIHLVMILDCENSNVGSVNVNITMIIYVLCHLKNVTHGWNLVKDTEKLTLKCVKRPVSNFFMTNLYSVMCEIFLNNLVVTI